MKKLFGSGIASISVAAQINLIGRAVTDFTFIPETDVGIQVNGGAAQLVKAGEVLVFPGEVRQATLTAATDVRWYGIEA